FKIQGWSGGAERMFGYKETDAIGKDPSFLIPDQNHETRRQYWRDRLAAFPGEVIDQNLTLTKKNGSRFPTRIRVSLLSNEQKELTGYVGIISDESVLEKTLDRLRVAQERLRRAQKQASLGYFEWRIKEESLWVSEEIYKIYRIEPTGEDLPPNTLFRFIHADDQPVIEEKIWRAVGSGESFETEYRIKNSDGETRTIYQWVEIVMDDEGEAVTMRGTLQDITQQRQTESELIAYKVQLETMVRERTQQIEELSRDLVEASRQAGMAEVATGVLHNVGNVLNTVNISVTQIDTIRDKLSSQPLSRVYELLEQNKGHLGDFLDHSEKGKELLSYLNALSKLQDKLSTKMKLEIKDLQDSVEHIKQVIRMQQVFALGNGIIDDKKISDLLEEAIVISGIQTDGYIEIVRDYISDDLIRVDTHKFLQILVNLLTNARDAIKTSGKGTGKVSLKVRRHAGIAEVSIIDTGIGLTETNRRQIFSMGYTTKPDGHGYGLHTSANLAHDLGGNLTAESKGQNQGTCFTLRIKV
ncbi:MAG: PAS domain-containing sensor histidine kinase, partial [Gammaproteobacteria bacterium]|nr:PAS domain-containing sensor histidine kinase [Gammaproteobacteria bacterium]